MTSAHAHPLPDARFVPVTSLSQTAQTLAAASKTPPRQKNPSKQQGELALMRTWNERLYELKLNLGLWISDDVLLSPPSRHPRPQQHQQRTPSHKRSHSQMMAGHGSGEMDVYDQLLQTEWLNSPLHPPPSPQVPSAKPSPTSLLSPSPRTPAGSGHHTTPGSRSKKYSVKYLSASSRKLFQDYSPSSASHQNPPSKALSLFDFQSPVYVARKSLELGGLVIPPDSPSSSKYSSLPLSLSSQSLLTGPRLEPRAIPKTPYKVLDAPDLQVDFNYYFFPKKNHCRSMVLRATLN